MNRQTAKAAIFQYCKHCIFILTLSCCKVQLLGTLVRFMGSNYILQEACRDRSNGRKSSMLEQRPAVVMLDDMLTQHACSYAAC